VTDPGIPEVSFVDVQMTPEQLCQWEAVFNDDLSHRAKFLPPEPPEPEEDES
jgi:hypothetical protein